MCFTFWMQAMVHSAMGQYLYMKQILSQRLILTKVQGIKVSDFLLDILSNFLQKYNKTSLVKLRNTYTVWMGLDRTVSS